MAVERTFALLKPGVLQRRIVGELLSRLEKSGFRIIACKLIQVSRDVAETHYAEHREKSFYPSLVEYMESSPSIAMVLEREDAIASLRKLAGATDPAKAAPGTIRADYAIVTQKNIIHASDSPESAEREINLFFSREEIHPFEDGNAEWY
jgi:nucleoside-diphosphate kinase